MFYVILLVWFVYEIVNDVMIQTTGSGILFTHKKVCSGLLALEHLLLSCPNSVEWLSIQIHNTPSEYEVNEVIFEYMCVFG